MRLPDFFILGAAKSGTSTLYELLRRRTQVYFPFAKEPMFFNHDGYYARGLDWYAGTFFGGSSEAQIRGEATPHYLYWAQKVAPRIREAYPGGRVKFIVIFREPVARAYSWYWNMVREGTEELTFEQALAQESWRIKQDYEKLSFAGSMLYGYFRGGCYADQLKSFLAYFGREQFLFLLQDELSREPAAVIARVEQFLGLEETASIEILHENRASMPRNRILHALIRRPSVWKAAIKAILPTPLRHRVKSALINANLQEFSYPRIQPNTERALRRRYRDQVGGLQDLIEMDLADWLNA